MPHSNQLVFTIKGIVFTSLSNFLFCAILLFCSKSFQQLYEKSLMPVKMVLSYITSSQQDLKTGRRLSNTSYSSRQLLYQRLLQHSSRLSLMQFQVHLRYLSKLVILKTTYTIVEHNSVKFHFTSSGMTVGCSQKVSCGKSWMCCVHQERPYRCIGSVPVYLCCCVSSFLHFPYLFGTVTSCHQI